MHCLIVPRYSAPDVWLVRAAPTLERTQYKPVRIKDRLSGQTAWDSELNGGQRDVLLNLRMVSDDCLDGT